MYLLSYFRTESEALHLAVSDSGLHWLPLNDNAPVYIGTAEVDSLRDPFVFQAQDGRFHLLATNSWQSHSIAHAVSEDLLTWREMRLLPVMASEPTVRNCWAPECFYDAERGVYQIIWSSSLAENNGSDDWNHRIWGATTQDFQHFTRAALFFDPDHSVIDATVYRHEGIYWMAYKDERGENRPDTPYKAIRIATTPRIGEPWTVQTEFVTPSLTEGPALFRHDGEWRLIYDHFMEEKYSILRSADGVHWSPVSAPVEFPPRPRHASVLEISRAVGENLLRVAG